METSRQSGLYYWCHFQGRHPQTQRVKLKNCLFTAPASCKISVEAKHQFQTNALNTEIFFWGGVGGTHRGNRPVFRSRLPFQGQRSGSSPDKWLHRWRARWPCRSSRTLPPLPVVSLPIVKREEVESIHDIKTCKKRSTRALSSKMRRKGSKGSEVAKSRQWRCVRGQATALEGRIF